ncbi:PcfB family protein [[Clostridium] innocuum]|nr:PcfB family protein [[Clostridium] innocuum]MCQ4711183.1 PcfB family protein [[Clostridium] innocuum]MCR0451646.1 PcfB family protein [[Clostridium] innocuum]
MSLQGIEVAANIALKIGGAATKSLAATLYAMLNDKKKVKGAARLNSMLQSGKELKVFAIRHEDLKTFCQEAKRYGVLYSVLKEKNNTDGICDIMVRAEDASKISRIVDKFELATIDTKAMRESILSERENQPLKDVPVMSAEEHDDLIDSLMSSTKQEEKSFAENPTIARTQKTSDVPSEHISKRANVAEDTSERPSVRQELKQIKSERELRIEKNKQRSKARGQSFSKNPNSNHKKRKSKKKEKSL